MVMVCIHYPLNPKLAKQCMGLQGHRPNWIANLELPFLNHKSTFDHALLNLTVQDLVDREEALEAFEKAKQEREELINNIDRKIWLASNETTLSDPGWRSHRRDPIDLSDPRISEINIKYRD